MNYIDKKLQENIDNSTYAYRLVNIQFSYNEDSPVAYNKDNPKMNNAYLRFFVRHFKPRDALLDYYEIEKVLTEIPFKINNTDIEYFNKVYKSFSNGTSTQIVGIDTINERNWEIDKTYKIVQDKAVELNIEKKMNFELSERQKDTIKSNSKDNSLPSKKIDSTYSSLNYENNGTDTHEQIMDDYYKVYDDFDQADWENKMINEMSDGIRDEHGDLTGYDY